MGRCGDTVLRRAEREGHALMGGRLVPLVYLQGAETVLSKGP